jgi:hypothetical protein
MMSLELAKQRREGLLREAELRHRAKALRATRKRDAGRRSALVWEIRRHTGRLSKGGPSNRYPERQRSPLGAVASRYTGDAALRVRTLGCTWTRRDNT